MVGFWAKGQVPNKDTLNSSQENQGHKYYEDSIGTRVENVMVTGEGNMITRKKVDFMFLWATVMLISKARE